MRVLGFCMMKKEFYYAVLEGTKKEPVLTTDKGKVITLDSSNIPQFLNWYKNEINGLINKTKPEKVSYYLGLGIGGLKKDQILTSAFPIGVLNLVSYDFQLPVDSYTPSNLVMTKLGFPKDTDKDEVCNRIFGNNPPYWNKYLKKAILVAWFSLK
mgnify:CR=1 FL=1